MTNFRIIFALDASEELNDLEIQKDKKSVLKSVRKTLGLMETNLKHPSLNTHKYSEFKGPKGEDVFESYAQNNTPGAYRIFWHYGPNKKEITILRICPHP